MRMPSQSNAIVLVGFLGSIVTLITAWDNLRWLGRYAVGAAVLVCFGFLVHEYFPWPQYPIAKSGMAEFRPGFEPEETKPILYQATEEFCYFGVSFSSVFNVFSNWYRDAKRHNVRSVKILLADPDSAATMKFSAGWDGQEADLVRKRIQTSIDEIRNLAQGRTTIEVRAHRTECRQWMYLVDGKRIYVGLMKKGSDRHHNAVAIFQRGHSAGVTWNLFDHFQQEWQRLWELGTPLLEPPPAIARHAPIDITPDEARSNYST